jgi:hypothetical protein
MFSMILQIGGVWNIINGIISAVQGANFSDANRNGKLKFWYQ